MVLSIMWRFLDMRRLAKFCVCLALTSAAPSFGQSAPSATFAAAQVFPACSEPLSVAAGDFRGNGEQDVVVACYEGNDVTVLLNGPNGFQQEETYAVGTAPRGVVVGDFNGDGKLDLAVANELSNNVSILIGNGDGTFQPAATYAAGSAPYSIALGDFNGDGKLDLVVANVGDDSVRSKEVVTRHLSDKNALLLGRTFASLFFPDDFHERAGHVMDLLGSSVVLGNSEGLTRIRKGARSHARRAAGNALAARPNSARHGGPSVFPWQGEYSRWRISGQETAYPFPWSSQQG
jgi:hypothetical protein